MYQGRSILKHDGVRWDCSVFLFILGLYGCPSYCISAFVFLAFDFCKRKRWVFCQILLSWCQSYTFVLDSHSQILTTFCSSQKLKLIVFCLSSWSSFDMYFSFKLKPFTLAWKLLLPYAVLCFPEVLCLNHIPATHCRVVHFFSVFH